MTPHAPHSPPRSAEVHDAWEAIPGSPEATLALCCEHASARIPAPWTTTPADAPWMGTHWAIDLGARALTLGLAKALGAPAVLSRFSRLLCDANRPESAPDLCRPEVEGHPLSFNVGVDAAERQRRLDRFYRPYHAQIDHMLNTHRPRLLFSVHTFTPVYIGAPRSVQVGVLFDLHDELAARFADLLQPLDLLTELNQPWSGKAGLAFSPDLHGRKAGIPYLELEVRQDLLATPGRVEQLTGPMALALAELCAGLPEVHQGPASS